MKDINGDKVENFRTVKVISYGCSDERPEAIGVIGIITQDTKDRIISALSGQEICSVVALGGQGYEFDNLVVEVLEDFVHLPKVHGMITEFHDNDDDDNDRLLNKPARIWTEQSNDGVPDGFTPVWIMLDEDEGVFNPAFRFAKFSIDQ